MDERLGMSATIECGIALKRAQHLLELRIDEALRSLGLSTGLWRVLREMASRPDASASELARATCRTPQTLSALLRRAVDRGLVERTAGRGRVVENRLTATGHEVLAVATQRAEGVVSAALTRLDASDRAHFARLATLFADADADAFADARGAG